MKKSFLLALAFIFIVPLVSSIENDISLGSYNVQLGDSFNINGNNIEYNNIDFTGNAMVKFYGQSGDYTLLTQIVDGEFSQSASFCDANCIFPGLAGNYSMVVSLLDVSLVTLEEFTLPDLLIVNNKLNLILNLNEVQIDPGEKIKLEGSAQRDVDAKIFENGEVTIFFDEVEYKTLISNNKFVYEFITNSDISSGYHDLDVYFTDINNNFGEASIQFFVVGIPQLLNVNFDKEFYLPGEIVRITPSLVDQAGEGIVGEIELRLYDGDGRRQIKNVFSSNDGFDYFLENSAAPGEWKVSVKADGLKMDRYFSVETVEKLGLVLDGQKLIMTNIGNVAYSDSLKLQDENGNIIDKRTGLEPGENMSIILYTVFDEGQQTFQVLNTGENFTVEITDNRNIGNKLGDFFSGITGQAIRSSGSGTSNAPFLLLIGLIFGMLIYASFILRKKGKFSGVKLKKSKLKISSTEVDDIKSRILKDIKESKMDRKNESSFDVKPVVENTPPKRVKFDEPMRKSNDIPAPVKDNTKNLFKLFD
jgi:hypothetical protein